MACLRNAMIAWVLSQLKNETNEECVDDDVRLGFDVRDFDMRDFWFTEAENCQKTKKP